MPTLVEQGVLGLVHNVEVDAGGSVFNEGRICSNQRGNGSGRFGIAEG